jgi:glycosyltransferase involved in cell wall biosynthesis
VKIGFVAPDDLSTLIFCEQFSDAFAGDPSIEMVTISAMTQYHKDLERLASRHIPLAMNRFVSPLDDARYTRGLYRLFRKERFDAVVTFTTKPNIFGIPAARAAGVPVRVMAVRGLGRAFEKATTLKGRLLNAFVSTLYDSAARASSMAWFTNTIDKGHFVDRGVLPEHRTLLTPNAVNLKTWSPASVDAGRQKKLRAELGLANDQLSVVMVARLIWSKGIAEFADAARIVHRQLPNARFILVAPPEPESPGAIPESWVRERERAGDIQWVGFRKDVLDLYALGDLAVLPSYYNEGGYPRALLEPMSLGKAVIAADTPVCRGPVAEAVNGFVVPPRDAAALADAVIRILSDSSLRERFGAASLARIHEKFDDRIVAGEVIARIRAIRDQQRIVR